MSIILSLGGVYYNEFVEPLQLNEPPDVQMKQLLGPFGPLDCGCLVWISHLRYDKQPFNLVF